MKLNVRQSAALCEPKRVRGRALYTQTPPPVELQRRDAVGRI